MVVERVRAVLQLLHKRQRTGWAVERSDRARTHGCAPRRGFSLREIARREGRCQRRPSDPAARGERCEHMNEVTILAPNEVVEQLEASERLPQDIDPDTLRKYFTLTRPDLEQVDQCRGVANKLGFAVQLCTLRWRGHFLRDRSSFFGTGFHENSLLFFGGAIGSESRSAWTCLTKVL